MKDVLKLVVCILLCEMAGGIGAVFTGPAIGTWYTTLNKPSFNPPNWVFAPVWTTLYLLMGVSLFIVWRSGARPELLRPAVVLFAVQLALNVLWTVLFFGLKCPLLGLVEIAILWTAILLTIVTFWRISPIAGALLIPYILWVSFASALNYWLWRLNT